MKRFLFIVTCSFQSIIAQQIDYVDFKTVKAEVSFQPEVSKVFGTVYYTFHILKKTDSVSIDAVNMKFNTVRLNGKSVQFSNHSKKISIRHHFKKNKTYKLSFNYEASPKKALYFIDWNNNEGNKQIWTQGQGKYTSNWLPSFDDMNEKAEFDLAISFNKDYKVIANGKLIDKIVQEDSITWHYDMQAPMSSYLVALAIGKYNKQITYSASHVPLELYFYPEDTLKVEPTYRYTKQMFDFLETEIGVAYPWQNYKQIPVKDFMYGGMENTGTTIFADGFVVDSIAFADKNYINVNAHELAHQWFGNLVTASLGKHHWLQEGFATYYALLAERAVFGENYYYWRLYEYARELLEQDKKGAGTPLLDPKASSATFYKRGAWVLHILRERVGDGVFRAGIMEYLKKYQFKNAETTHFIAEVEALCNCDLSNFVEIWLKDDVFNYNLALESLKKSAFINEYLMVDCEIYTSKCADYLSSGISDEAKIKIVGQISEYVTKADFDNGLKVRQAIAQSLNKIPQELKFEYESLLNDASYITKETALYNLWSNFPKEQSKYLNQTKGIQGFNDKNIRMLWLALALVTDGFEDGNKNRFYNELLSYTSSNFASEIRQNAFQYLNLIQACNDTCVENLKQATTHYNWRFSQFSKQLLKKIQQ
ncbi:MAG: M1 family metallopeptidase [Aestuariibaculum sp.]